MLQPWRPAVPQHGCLPSLILIESPVSGLCRRRLIARVTAAQCRDVKVAAAIKPASKLFGWWTGCGGHDRCHSESDATVRAERLQRMPGFRLVGRVLDGDGCASEAFLQLVRCARTLSFAAAQFDVFW